MTQREAVLNYIDEYGSISPMEAFRDLGITKLATVVSDMRRDGVEIHKQSESVKNRYGKTVYFMRYSR